MGALGETPYQMWANCEVKKLEVGRQKSFDSRATKGFFEG